MDKQDIKSAHYFLKQIEYRDFKKFNVDMLALKKLRLTVSGMDENTKSKWVIKDTKFKWDVPGFLANDGDIHDIDGLIELYNCGLIFKNPKTINYYMRFPEKCVYWDGPILITGPRGSGKENTAKFLHEKICRLQRKQVVVNDNAKGFPVEQTDPCNEMKIINCAAFSDDLFESEFFGHKRGAFTGAITDKQGFVETAKNGTIFLDEIDTLSLRAQAKLLRFIIDKKFNRLGDSVERKANVRIIAATNKEYSELIGSENKRRLMIPDFIDRIYRMRFIIPEWTPEDRSAQFQYFILKSMQQGNIQSLEIPDELCLLASLINYSGSVRELEKVAYDLVHEDEFYSYRPDHQDEKSYHQTKKAEMLFRMQMFLSYLFPETRENLLRDREQDPNTEITFKETIDVFVKHLKNKLEIPDHFLRQYEQSQPTSIDVSGKQESDCFYSDTIQIEHYQSAKKTLMKRFEKDWLNSILSKYQGWDEYLIGEKAGMSKYNFSTFKNRVLADTV